MVSSEALTVFTMSLREIMDKFNITGVVRNARISDKLTWVEADNVLVLEVHDGI